jgi:hypothetical protein
MRENTAPKKLDAATSSRIMLETSRVDMIARLKPSQDSLR